MDSKISVIVPVYNVEPYVRECIESICGQTYRHLEIILVDDGSTDQSGAICDEYARKDSRVQIVHQKNGGLSAARNTGIAMATGEYISLIDSDDFIGRQMLERMLAAAKASHADIVICNYSDVYADGLSRGHLYGCKKEMSGYDAFQKLLEDGDAALVVAWNKLYRASLFQGRPIRYPVGRIHEDCFTTYKLYMRASKVAYLEEALYFYRHREGSIMESGPLQARYDIVRAYREIYEYVSAKEKGLAEAAEYRYILANLDVIRKVGSWRYKRSILKSRENILGTNFRQNRFLKGQRKLRVKLLCACPFFYPKLNRLIELVKHGKLFLERKAWTDNS